jgi:hypothetical protein
MRPSVRPNAVGWWRNVVLNATRGCCLSGNTSLGTCAECRHRGSSNCNDRKGYPNFGEHCLLHGSQKGFVADGKAHTMQETQAGCREDKGGQRFHCGVARLVGGDARTQLFRSHQSMSWVALRHRISRECVWSLPDLPPTVTEPPRYFTALGAVAWNATTAL